MNLLETVVTAADDKRALDIVALDMTQTSSLADAFVIMEAMNPRQMDAIADNIVEEAGKLGVHANGRIEGEGKSGWILVDLGDIVVSIFGQEERRLYNIEKLWSDAPLINVEKWVSE